jgi:hypothetical protein
VGTNFISPWAKKGHVRVYIYIMIQVFLLVEMKKVKKEEMEGK